MKIRSSKKNVWKAEAIDDCYYDIERLYDEASERLPREEEALEACITEYLESSESATRDDALEYHSWRVETIESIKTKMEVYKKVLETLMK